MSEFNESEGETNRPQSEFNSAVSYLNRINYIFALCDESSLNLDVNAWFHLLLCLYRELYTEASMKEIKEIDIQIKELNPAISEYNEEKKMKGEIDITFYQKLHDFEIALRRVYKGSGLMLRMSEDAMKALR